jgi:hypothetical protein
MDVASRLEAELALTGEQVDVLRDLLDRHGDLSPATAARIAAELHLHLTDAQRSHLRDAFARMRTSLEDEWREQMRARLHGPGSLTDDASGDATEKRLRLLDRRRGAEGLRERFGDRDGLQFRERVENGDGLRTRFRARFENEDELALDLRERFGDADGMRLRIRERFGDGDGPRLRIRERVDGAEGPRAWFRDRTADDGTAGSRLSDQGQEIIALQRALLGS